MWRNALYGMPLYGNFGSLGIAPAYPGVGVAASAATRDAVFDDGSDSGTYDSDDTTRGDFNPTSGRGHLDCNAACARMNVLMEAMKRACPECELCKHPPCPEPECPACEEPVECPAPRREPQQWPWLALIIFGYFALTGEAKD